MSYALIKQNGVYIITDLTLLIGGAFTRGYTVQVRNESDELEDAMFIGMGRESEMIELKESEEAAGKTKGRGRKRGAPKPLFTLHSPHRGNLTVPPEEEEDVNQSGVEEIDEMATRSRSLRPRRSTRSRDPSPYLDSSRDSSPALITPSALPPSSTPFDPQWLLDSIRSIVREEVKSIVREEEKEVKKRIDSIVDYINRREGRELTQRNCVEKIAQTLVSNESQQDHVEKKLDDLSTLVDKAVKHLPAAPTEFNYDQFGMSEAEVANCESDLPSFVVFAARLADKLFPDQMSLPFKRRDPARILWLTQCLIRRRKWSLGNDITQNMNQVRTRIDTNARNYLKRIAQGRTAVDRMPKHNIRGVGGKFAPKKRPVQKGTVPSTPSIVPSYPQHSSVKIRPNSSQGFAQRNHTFQTSHQLDYDTPTTSRSMVNQFSQPHHDVRVVSRNSFPQQSYVPRSNLFSPHSSLAPMRPDYGRMESAPPRDDPNLYNPNELDDVDYVEETEYHNNNGFFDDEWEEEVGESLYSDSTYHINRRL